ncbi:hypothetical protein O0I10_003445 [Lichtheimia ornata]|uniref:Cytochrome P450 n=1 Tax=Lichtheimia ornata TaxID=688661 RepID=A0AAD7Y2I5_9FUNG|nr:uncharacterized protein O0I10_003445 [Lichtheimia ornata]KAJ8660802.1 hypothetical protein O0I10_003445 [Lichtheimia ornata]
MSSLNILSLLDNKHINAFFDNPSRAQSGIIAGSVAIVSLCAAYSLGSRLRGSNNGVPLVPYTFPIIGSTREYRDDPQAFIEKWTAKLGPVFRVHLFGRIHTVVSDRYVREVFLNNDFDFLKGTGKRFDTLLLTDTTLQDVDIEVFRMVVMKHLTKEMKHYTPRVVEHLTAGGDEKLGDAKEPKELVHLFPLLQHMVAKASASIFVGTELAADDAVVETCKNIAIDIGSELGPSSYIMDAFPSLARLRMWYIGKYGKAINKHRQHLLHALGPVIDKRLAAAEKGGDWDRPQDILQDIIETINLTLDNPKRHILPVKWLLALFFASIHTTSENSTIVLYRIMQNPEIIDVLLEEQNEVLEKHYGTNIDYSDTTKLFTGEVIKDLVKLDSVCREAMRSRNSYLELPHTYVGKSRITLSCGAVIEPGHDVLINMWGNHRDAKIQRDTIGDHHDFKPFRFVGLDRQSTKIGDDFLMFGQGRHACPGRWFAIQEIKTIVSVLIRYYKLTPKGPITFPTHPRMPMPAGEVIIQRRE